MVPVIPVNPSPIESRIAELVGQQRYDFWFANRVRIGISQSELTISASNRHFLDLLASRYRTPLETVATEFLGRTGVCRFLVTGDPFPQPPLNANQPIHKTLPASIHPGDSPKNTHPRDLPTGRTLEDFIVSDSNRMAVFSARSFLEPGNGIGLLVLVAPPSRGKSHILDGLKNQYLSQHNGVVKHLEGESFVARFLDSLRKGKAAAFRKSMLDCDLLMIDDLDKLEGKPSCQGEFLAILESARQREIKVAVSLCQTPRQTPGLGQLVVERLQSGLTCPIGPLDSGGKTRLLRQHLGKLGIGLITEDFVQGVGPLLPDSPREIEGIAQKVWLLSRLEARPVDLEILHSALGDLARPTNIRSLESMTEVVAGVLGTTVEAIMGRSKSPLLEMGRLFVYFFARKMGGHSSTEIGSFFKGRSHSTIINGSNQVSKLLSSPGTTKRWPSNWKGIFKQAEQLLNYEP